MNASSEGVVERAEACGLLLRPIYFSVNFIYGAHEKIKYV
jgi:hypothetical protein